MSALGSLLRSAGRTVDKIGLSIQGNLGYFERLVPSTTALGFKNSTPATAKAAFIAPNTSIVGKATVAESASVWFGAALRGDLGEVSIGERSSIGERTTVSSSSIGAGVTVGPNSTINGANVGDNVLIGANSVVGEGVKIGARSIIQPGSVLAAGTSVPTGHVFAGNPAVSVRQVTDAEIDMVKELAVESMEQAFACSFEAEKSFGDLLDEKAEKEWQQNLASDHWRDADYGRVDSRTGTVYNRRNTE